MKAHELRIGNWVDLYGTKTQIVKIDFDKDFERFKPIPLTEEWLVKLGFIEVSEHMNHGTLKSLELHTANDSFIVAQFRPEEHGLIWISLTDCDHEGFIFTRIQYVHQLQNLYHALTGEELTIK